MGLAPLGGRLLGRGEAARHALGSGVGEPGEGQHLEKLAEVRDPDKSRVIGEGGPKLDLAPMPDE